MLIAKTSKGNFVSLVHLSQEEIAVLRSKEKFYCPDCKSQVIIRSGPKTTPHFAHMRHTSCTYFSQGESAYHEAGKVALYKWLTKQRIASELEAHIMKTNQRTDVLAKVGKRAYALEFQCSVITLHDINKRRKLYSETNVTPLWFLSKKMFKRRSKSTIRMNGFLLHFLHYFIQEESAVLYFLCPQKKILTTVSDITLLSPQNAQGVIRSQTLTSLSFSSLFKQPYKIDKNALFNEWLLAKKKFRLMRMNYRGRELAYRNWLYERGFHVATLPSIIYVPTKFNVIFSVAPWIWQGVVTLQCFAPLPIGGRLTVEKIISVVRRYVHPYIKHSHFFDSLLDSAIISYLDILQQEKLVEKVEKRTYMKMTSLPKYANVEEALHEDAEVLRRFMYNLNKKDV